MVCSAVVYLYFTKVCTVPTAPRPRLRHALSALAVTLLIPALVACGGEEKTGYGDETVSGFDGVTVSAAVDKAPTLKWESAIAYPKDPKVKTLTEGEGEEIPEGRGVFARSTSATPPLWTRTGPTRARRPRVRSSRRRSRGAPS